MLCYCVIGGCCLTLMELSHGALAHCRITKSAHDELNTKSFTPCTAPCAPIYATVEMFMSVRCANESKSSHKIRAMHSNYTWRSHGMSTANLPCERILMTWKASFVRITSHSPLARRSSASRKASKCKYGAIHQNQKCKWNFKSAYRSRIYFHFCRRDTDIALPFHCCRIRHPSRNPVDIAPCNHNTNGI